MSGSRLKETIYAFSLFYHFCVQSLNFNVSKRNDPLVEADCPDDLPGARPDCRAPPQPSEGSFVRFCKREREMFIDGRRTFPVFGLLAHPTPSLLVSAHNTWQKFPGMIIIKIVMRIRNLYLESRFQTQSHIVPPRCTRETPEVHQQPMLINISLLFSRSGLRYIFRFKVNLR